MRDQNNDGFDIPSSEEKKDLDITFAKSLKFNKHVLNVVNIYKTQI